MPTEEYQNVPFDQMDEHIREIAREEIASLSGMMLRRLQDKADDFTRSPDRNMALETTTDILSALWGEALADFSGHTGSGDEPGEADA